MLLSMQSFDNCFVIIDSHVVNGLPRYLKMCVEFIFYTCGCVFSSQILTTVKVTAARIMQLASMWLIAMSVIVLVVSLENTVKLILMIAKVYHAIIMELVWIYKMIFFANVRMAGKGKAAFPVSCCVL